jgi:hypothetical protein
MNAPTKNTQTAPRVSRALRSRLEAKRKAARPPGDWRAAAWAGKNPHTRGPRDGEHADIGIDKNAGVVRWLDACGSEYFKAEYAHELAKLGYTGWFSDDDQDGLYVGVVAHMRTARGVILVPGYEDSKFGGVCLRWDAREFLPRPDFRAGPLPRLESGEAWREAMADALRECARDADRIAERAAAASRKFQRAGRLRQDADALYECDYSALRGEVSGVLDAIRARRAGLSAALAGQLELFPLPGPAAKGAALRRRLGDAFDLEARESDLRERLAALLGERAGIHAKARAMREDASEIERWADMQ